MPSAPIFGDIARKIRTDEVLLHLYSKHLCNTDGYVYAAGEVGIKLGCVQNGADENIRARVRRRIAAQRCDRSKQSVGNDELFKVAPKNALKAEGYLLKVGLMLGKKRILQIAEARYRPLNEQRKE